MKALYEKNKKLFYGIAAGCCLLVCLCIAAGIYFIGGGRGRTEDKSTGNQVVQTAADVSTVQKPEETEEPYDYEEVTQEAAEASQEAVEIVEDSELDVVEAVDPAAVTKPAVTASTAPQESAAPTQTPNPTVNVTNMAQNVPFPYEIHVNKQMNCMTIYAMDTNGSYSIPLKAMVCSTGQATPLGAYRTPAKYIWKILKGNVWGQYSTRISGGILFHSVPYRTNRKDALISKYYNKLGTTASAGCVRLTTADAKWIYDNCPLGTMVIIYNDSNPGPLGKPSAMKVPASNKWDPTDPDPANPWTGKVLRIEGTQNQVVERGNSVNLMAGVTATDTSGQDVTGRVQISTNADTNKAGVYGVHYLITDELGNTASADATLTVVDTQVPVFQGVPARIEGRKAAEITRELLLNGVTVTDNGQNLPAGQIEVQIPALHDGENQIVYAAWDDSGNRTTASTIVYCDMTAPVITRNAGVRSVLELNESITMNTALSRISVQDMSSVNVDYTLTEEGWGYKIDYTVSDSYGNVSNLTDHVFYRQYKFSGDTYIQVSSINNTEELKQGLTLRDDEGREVGLPADIKITATPDNSAVYTVVYTYTYNSPVGSKTAQYERTVIVSE